MKRWLPLAVIAAVSAACFGGGKKLAPFEVDAMRLGVVTPFAYAASDKAYADIAKSVDGHLSTELFATKRLRLIDRERLNTTLTELSLPAGGVPLDSAMIAKVCEKLKAEVAVYGQVLSVRKDEEKRKNRTTETLEIEIEAKLVFAKSAEMLSTSRAVGKAVVVYKDDKRPPSELLVSEALSDAAHQLAYQLVTELQPK